MIILFFPIVDYHYNSHSKIPEIKIFSFIYYQLIQLQELVHDTEGSNITEDYKDYAVLFGEDGIKHFVDTLDSLLVDAEDTLNDFERQTHS